MNPMIFYCAELDEIIVYVGSIVTFYHDNEDKITNHYYTSHFLSKLNKPLEQLMIDHDWVFIGRLD